MGYTPHCIGYRSGEHGCAEYRATGKMPPYFSRSGSFGYQYVDPTTLPADEVERLLNRYYSSENRGDGTIDVEYLFEKEDLKKNQAAQNMTARMI